MRPDRPDRPFRHGRRPIVGLIVIVFGTLALLGNLNVIDAHALQPYWPLAFVFVGLLGILRRRCYGPPVGAVALAVVGAAMTAQNLGYVHFNWHDWWPALIILGGVAMILRSFYPHRHRGFRHSQFRQSQIDHGNVLNIKSAFSGTSLRNDSQDFQGGIIDLSLAGLELDLRQASIVGEAQLRISATMSGVNIRVPTDWQVMVQGVPTMGGVEDRTVPPMNPTKRLVIHADVVMGGLEIRN